jgi:hypothetical protein
VDEMFAFLKNLGDIRWCSRCERRCSQSFNLYVYVRAFVLERFRGSHFLILRWPEVLHTIP